MKLLTHNFMTSKCLKRVNVGFPLGIVETNNGEINYGYFTILEQSGCFMAREIKETEVPFNGEFISRMIPKIDWDVLCDAAISLVPTCDLPKTVSTNYENDDEFLKKAHHVLLEIEVISGELICPETGIKFPVSNGIPNMLANEDEV